MATSVETYQVERVDLVHFEMLVYSRRTKEAGEELLQLLKRLKIGAEFAPEAFPDPGAAALYTRLGGAITSLLTDPAARLAQHGYDLLVAEHATLHAVFGASAFGSADHLVRYFSEADSAEPARLQIDGTQNLMKLLLAYSLDSDFDVDFEALLRVEPGIAVPALLALLGGMVVLSPRAHRRRERLLRLGPLLERAPLRDSMLTTAQRAFMHCSYGTGSDKHEIKASLNAMTRRFLGDLFSLPSFPAERLTKPRPTVLVPLEWFHSRHAMYRCYAQLILRLRSSFRLVGMGHVTVMDEVSKSIFDEVIELSGSDVMLSDALGHAERVAPDIVYYPSVGMAWCTALSTIRLAPIQIASMGHPASTRSEVVDYMIVPECGPGEPSCYSEIVLVGEGMPPILIPEGAVFPRSEPEARPGVLRIAIPAMVCKLNAPFLALCRNLVQKAGRVLEFHFFPGAVGLDLEFTKCEIGKWLTGAVVHRRLNYNEYLERLGACHIHLSPFPFGGTNSNLDSMRCAVPIVAFEGQEAHSQSDAAMMRHVGLGNSLIARSLVEYESIALRLIKNDSERVSVARQLQHLNIAEKFFGDSGFADDFLRIIRWVYQENEAIKVSGKRFWSVADRRGSFPMFSS